MKYRLRAIFTAILLSLSCGSIASAQTTITDFLEWDREQQDFLFHIAISATGYVARQNQPEIVACLNEWYFASQPLRQQRHIEMLAAMPDFGEFPPTAVVVGFVQQACGPFGDD